MSETKEYILKTAFSLFLRKSFKEVTMKDIVKETGLSKGAFYHYFPSKEKLFFEVIDTFYFNNVTVDFDMLTKNSLKEFYRDYIAHLNKSLEILKKLLANSNVGMNLNYITILLDAMNLFPEVKDKTMKIMRDELDTWKEVIKFARSNKEFLSPMTDDQIARMFIYSSDGIGLRLLLEGKTEIMYDEMLILWDNFYKELVD